MSGPAAASRQRMRIELVHGSSPIARAVAAYQMMYCGLPRPMLPCMLVLTIKAEKRMVVTRSPISSVGARSSASKPQSTKKMVTKICLIRKTTGFRVSWSDIWQAFGMRSTSLKPTSAGFPISVHSLVLGSKRACHFESVRPLVYGAHALATLTCALSQA
eukprot:scaffold4518_cov129-Isochrysis_galbana.AAC.1